MLVVDYRLERSHHNRENSRQVLEDRQRENCLLEVINLVHFTFNILVVSLSGYFRTAFLSTDVNCLVHLCVSFNNRYPASNSNNLVSKDTTNVH